MRCIQYGSRRTKVFAVSTALVAAASILPTRAVLVPAARPAPRTAGAVVALRRSAPQPGPVAAVPGRSAVVRAGAAPAAPAPRPTALRTRPLDAPGQGRPTVPRTTRAGVRRLAALVAFTSTRPPTSTGGAPPVHPRTVPAARPRTVRAALVVSRTPTTPGLNDPALQSHVVRPGPTPRRAGAVVTAGRRYVAAPGPPPKLVPAARRPVRAGAVVAAAGAAPAARPRPPTVVRAGRPSAPAPAPRPLVVRPGPSTSARPRPAVVARGVAPARSGPVVARSGPPRALTLPVPKIVLAARRPPRAGLVVDDASAPVPGTARPRPLVVPTGRRTARPALPATVARTWPASPPRTDPRPRPVVVPVGRRAPRPGAVVLPVQSPRVGQAPPPDLFAAVCQWLENYAGLAVAFGHSAATPKFLDAPAPRDVVPPYCTYTEISEPRSYESADRDGSVHAYGDGSFQLSIFGQQKAATRALARSVVAALDDAPLTCADGDLLYLRVASASFPVIADVGPAGQITSYQRVIEFKYIIDRPFP